MRTDKKLHQRLIVTYSPEYASYQKSIREKQIERAEKMVQDGKFKRTGKNPDDPARFVAKIAATEDGEAADIHYYLDEDKIQEEVKEKTESKHTFSSASCLCSSIAF